MGRDAFLGDLVHLLGANLDFERLHVGTDHRGVQRLVEIVARRGDPVFDAAGNGFPVVMDHAQSRVAMANFIRSDDPRGDQIVNLIQTDLLAPQFFPDRIEPLDASFDEHKRHFRFVHLLLRCVQ